MGQIDKMDKQDQPKILFSDYFEVDTQILASYGAYNISLVADLPLFIDPFLLFNSKKEEYQKLHEEMITYLRFLKKKSLSEDISDGLLLSLYRFKEVEQNWFGFTREGNKGSALGTEFARALNENFHRVFPNYGEEEVTQSPHLEKLCLIKEGVGKDNISDFTTNLIKEFLLNYTQTFARSSLKPEFCNHFRVPKVKFNYDTESWMEEEYYLPEFRGNYVILTPKDMLTKDDTWINRDDLTKDFYKIPSSIPNEELRAKINNYLRKVLPDNPTHKEERAAANKAIREFPELLDYFIRLKEENGEKAVDISSQKVKYSEDIFLHSSKSLAFLLSKTPFYSLFKTNSYKEVLDRAKFLKQVIENNDGYKIFYRHGKCISREDDLKILFRLIWYRSPYEVDTEVNNGRGPVDTKVSLGSLDKSLVEFKLGSNSQLKKNLENQVQVYENANNTNKSVKIIVYFSAKQYKRVISILKELKLDKAENIVLIDARNDNKPSASKAIS